MLLGLCRLPFEVIDVARAIKQIRVLGVEPERAVSIALAGGQCRQQGCVTCGDLKHGLRAGAVAKADRRFSPEAIRRCLNRLLEVRQQQELLSAEQKELHEQLRLAHLRGDLAQQLPAGKDGQGYQIKPDLLLYRRAGRKQWHYSLSCQELECQLKARQAYEQQSGEAERYEPWQEYPCMNLIQETVRR